MSFELPLYLASQSPRRKKLLQQINLEFKTFSVDINEDILENELPVEAVKRLASEKMQAAEKLTPKAIIITADTIVVLDNEILGKPKDEEDAFILLKKLSGKAHTVYTGFSIKNTFTGKTITDYETTQVKFRKLSDYEIKEYIKTGSPMDKAGAYGIQDDFGAVFVEKIDGCYYNVVGLPLAKIYKYLMEFS
ncbi:MAG: septum formation protein Maf [Ignavibacteria bacterium]|nr:septum formation protein Maf [Ignavibacteria bacterium]